jgi:ERCC4-related helicase
MNPHQVDAALFALKSPLSKGVLLGDEVGLGKTIEAGLVISQRWAEHRRRILLIAPASLRKQWAQELWEKFSIRSTILEAATFNAAVKAGKAKPFEDAQGVVIASYEFAARRAAEVQSVPWDLVVFDEAHRLRNVYKKDGSSRAKDLKAAVANSFKILLTATPLQNSLMELFGLVSIIDEEHFGGEKAFRQQFGGRNDVATLDVLRQRLEPVCKRTLRRQVQEAGHINFRRREARTFSFEPLDREAVLYERLSEFLKRRDTVSYGGKPNQLIILQARKILGSSTFAITQYLMTLIERLRNKERATLAMTDDVEDIDTLVEEAGDDGDDEAEAPPTAEQIAAEIVELEGLLSLAQSIGTNAKGEKLLAQLPEVLDQIVAKGGARKAVIFTESRRTQRYLAEILSVDYAGRIVLLNGSNNDDESKRVYAAWKAEHTGTDRISGSRTADMKAAIVDSFRSDDKTIMIATESGAEGINLQFCSLIVNFDLPWNPQRVEQRIGRCHRYGQKIDVTVVNMLNLKNQTEARIHELLSEKFHLFDGVFGASDHVLGTLMSGLDFEREVLNIVQNCRTEAEAEAQFDLLVADIKDRIDADVADAQARVLENMDADVVGKLQRRGQELQRSIPEFRQRLLIVGRGELPNAHVPDPAGERFEYEGQCWTTEWPQADERDWQFFRVNDGLGLELVEGAVARAGETPQEAVFVPSAYPFPGQLGAVTALAGRSGWMQVVKASIPTGDSVREELLVAAFDDDGNVIQPEAADKMMFAPASSVSEFTGSAPIADVESAVAAAKDGFDKRVKAENFQWVEAEEARLDAYARDLEIEFDARIAEKEIEIKDKRKEGRSPNLPMEEKVAISRAVKKLEGEVDELKFTKFQERKRARQEVEDKLDAFAASLATAATYTPVMTLRWHVAPAS